MFVINVASVINVDVDILNVNVFKVAILNVRN